MVLVIVIGCQQRHRACHSEGRISPAVIPSNGTHCGSMVPRIIKGHALRKACLSACQYCAYDDDDDRPKPRTYIVLIVLIIGIHPATYDLASWLYMYVSWGSRTPWTEGN